MFLGLLKYVVKNSEVQGYLFFTPMSRSGAFFCTCPLPELLDLSPVQDICLCVCNQQVYADYLQDAVDQLLIPLFISRGSYIVSVELIMSVLPSMIKS